MNSRQMCFEQGLACVYQPHGKPSVIVTEWPNGVMERHDLKAGTRTLRWPDGTEETRPADEELEAPQWPRDRRPRRGEPIMWAWPSGRRGITERGMLSTRTLQEIVAAIVPRADPERVFAFRPPRGARPGNTVRLFVTVELDAQVRALEDVCAAAPAAWPPLRIVTATPTAFQHDVFENGTEACEAAVFGKLLYRRMDWAGRGRTWRGRLHGESPP